MSLKNTGLGLSGARHQKLDPVVAPVNLLLKSELHIEFTGTRHVELGEDLALLRQITVDQRKIPSIVRKTATRSC